MLANVLNAYDKIRFDDSKAFGLSTIVRREEIGNKIVRILLLYEDSWKTAEACAYVCSSPFGACSLTICCLMLRGSCLKTLFRARFSILILIVIFLLHSRTSKLRLLRNTPHDSVNSVKFDASKERENLSFSLAMVARLTMIEPVSCSDESSYRDQARLCVYNGGGKSLWCPGTKSHYCFPCFSVALSRGCVEMR